MRRPEFANTHTPRRTQLSIAGDGFAKSRPLSKMGRVSSGKTRIAWITFDFPPRQSSGVFRAIKIYKYLDKSRFEVDFITHGSARRFQSAVHDDTLLGEVHPAPAVYRVPTIILHDFLPALRARLRRVKPSRGQSPTPPLASKPVPSPEPPAPSL